jgi:hypothetical protein
MSSLVQAKVHELAGIRASAVSDAIASFRKYSIALTSWFVVRSIAFTSEALSEENAASTASR